jgi:hypothetical protein
MVWNQPALGRSVAFSTRCHDRPKAGTCFAASRGPLRSGRTGGADVRSETLMRAVAAVLIGFALISSWCVAFVSNSAGWLASVEGAAGVVAVIAGFGLVRDSRAARAALAVEALVLFAGALVGFVSRGPAWFSWSALVLACGLAILGLSRVVFRVLSHARRP